MKKRITLYADDGMILTNGKEYGREVTLEIGLTGKDWHEITVEEYNAIQSAATAEE